MYVSKCSADLATVDIFMEEEEEARSNGSGHLLLLVCHVSISWWWWIGHVWAVHTTCQSLQLTIFIHAKQQSAAGKFLSYEEHREFCSIHNLFSLL
jgi:hypothetical protein